MRIFLATAQLDEIRWATDHGLIDGVLTTPALLAAGRADGDPRELLAEICRSAGLPVAASVSAVSSADIYRDGKELARMSDHMIVQIPLVEDAVGAMRRLRADGVRVMATLVYDAAQAILAARAGAGAVSTALADLQAVGQDVAAVLREMRQALDMDAVECDLVAEHPRNAAQFTACALAGADAAAVTPTVLRALLLHPLTDRGLDQFMNDLGKYHKGRSGA